MDWKEIIWFSAYGLVFIGLSTYGIHRYSVVYHFLKNRKSRPEPPRRFDPLPGITVQLPIFNELFVIERLLESVAQLDYPKELLQIQVLDDSTDETVEIAEAAVNRLADRGFDAQYIHRSDRTGFKAGALEHGLKTAKHGLIFILDADFVPPPGILHDLVHHFTDEKVGLVQARWGHINRRYSLLTRLQAIFLDGHLLLEQTARSRTGRFMNFNGTAGIWRRACIEDAGGWEHDTLTEDLDLSYRAQMKGWKFLFLDDVVAPAELPIDMDGFKSQQHRWTKGSVQCCKKLAWQVWRSPQPLRVKIEATFHLFANFAYLLMFGVCILMFPTDFGGAWGWRRFVFIDLPVFLLASVSVIAFYGTSQIWLYPRTWWKGALLMPAVLALGVGMAVNNGKAVIEALFNRPSEFVRTPKYGVGRRREAVSTRLRHYRALKSIGLVIEILLVGYFALLIAISIRTGAYLTIPFQMLFLIGFSFVAWGSLQRRLFGGREKVAAPTP